MWLTYSCRSRGWFRLWRLVPTHLRQPAGHPAHTRTKQTPEKHKWSTGDRSLVPNSGVTFLYLVVPLPLISQLIMSTTVFPKDFTQLVGRNVMWQAKKRVSAHAQKLSATWKHNVRYVPGLLSSSVSLNHLVSLPGLVPLRVSKHLWVCLSMLVHSCADTVTVSRWVCSHVLLLVFPLLKPWTTLSECESPLWRDAMCHLGDTRRWTRQTLAVHLAQVQWCENCFCDFPLTSPWIPQSASGKAFSCYHALWPHLISLLSVHFHKVLNEFVWAEILPVWSQFTLN